MNDEYTKGWVIINKDGAFLQLVVSRPGWSGDGGGFRFSANNAHIFANFRDAQEYIKRNLSKYKDIRICIIKHYMTVVK